MIEAGMRIGKYELVKQLGQGGFGMVFVARDRDLGRDCALKFLLARHTANADLLQRFLREARSAAMIEHGGIVTVYECGQIQGTNTPADGSAFIAMELLKGESLAARLARGALKPAVAMEIARQIASALASAHTANVVHRDLKPDNVFLVPDRAAILGERVKVLDFGIAKLAETSAPGADQTGSHIIFGTPLYMSPEQCRSTASVDRRTDIYALGVMLFEMLCGQRPFEGEVGALIAMHQMAPPPTLRSRRSDLAESIEELVAAMLAKAPEARPQTMDDVIHWLDALAPPGSLVVEAARAIAPGGEPAAAPRTGAAAKPTGVEPTVAPTGVEPTVAPTGVEPTAAPRTGAAAKPSGVEPTLLPAGVAPTVLPAPAGVAPTVLPAGGAATVASTPPAASSTPAARVTPAATAPAVPTTAATSVTPMQPSVPPVFNLSGGDGPGDRHVPGPGDQHGLSARGAARPWPWIVAIVALGGGALALYLAFGRSGREAVVIADAGRPAADAARDAALDAPAIVAPPGMVLIPAADFEMGSSEAEIDEALAFCKTLSAECKRSLYERERPLRQVHVSAFFLDAHERTFGEVAEWLDVRPSIPLRAERGSLWLGTTEYVQVDKAGAVSKTPRALELDGTTVRVKPGFADKPAVTITYAGARAFCRARGLDLPTEAQWERAARGVEHRKFPWGATAPTCDRAVYDRERACKAAGAGTVDVTTPTADRTPEGVLHLGGNVSEWVLDRFEPTYPACAEPCLDPVVAPTGAPNEAYVLRGGNAFGLAEMTRSAGRARDVGGHASLDTGFRCASKGPP